MSSIISADPAGVPLITTLQDLTIIEAFDPGANEPKYTTFYVLTPEDDLFFGESPKGKRELTLEECRALLKRVDDGEIYPHVPTDLPLTIAPAELNGSNAFIKRPGLVCYESMKGTDYVPKSVLDETTIMEKISKRPHPNIVKYHGCRVNRGRITALVLELLDQTLTQFKPDGKLQSLDRDKFVEALQSAVDYLHSLGLAHNDINPDNIMVKDGMPVLIDFGSCAPVGQRLQSLGTEGWYEELFFTSQFKHDIYAMGKLREWLTSSTEEKINMVPIIDPNELITQLKAHNIETEVNKGNWTMAADPKKAMAAIKLYTEKKQEHATKDPIADGVNEESE
ncbi:kinase-like domain-containing protein [Xylaria scruposa]|nr:kinase-like domain-containing protein [Xylaria scruposa]